MSQSSILIIGGGPSGSIAAIRLAKLGYLVQIVEKTHFPRFVIGESLLPKCNAILDEVGILDTVTNHGFIIKRGVGFTAEDGAHQTIHFCNNLGQKHNATFQVKREEFDTLLLQQAQAAGAKVSFGEEVIGYDSESKKATLKSDTGTRELACDFVMDASGYGRVLPRLLGLDMPSGLKQRKAVFARVEGYQRREGNEEGYIDVFIHGDNEAWIWAIPFSDGQTSVGVVCEESFYVRHGMDEAAFLDHILQTNKQASKRFQGYKKINEAGSIGGYSAAVSKMYGQGYVLTGNATEFLDPVFSSGVTLALESGHKAAELIHRELGGESVDWEAEYAAYMQLGIDVFREFVLAWYDGRLQKILFSREKNQKIVNAISAVLSGYVWDKNNFFHENTAKKLDSLLSIVESLDAK